MRRNSGSALESAYVRNCFGRCSQSHSECDYGECVVAIHVPPIKGTAEVTFKVLDGTEPTLSMPMLVANGNRVVFRGEDAMLITAKGEAAPLMNAGNDWYLKVLINNENVFIRIDVWAACHECPPSWVRCLSPENVERRTTPASTTITKTREGFEVKNSSSPQQTGAAGKRRNTQMLEDVDELVLAKPSCKVQESIKGWNDKRSKFEIEQEIVTDTPQCVISTVGHGSAEKRFFHWRNKSSLAAVSERE